ncbi:MAG: hypothetical protein ABEI96_07040 [Haloarculaceae archaeon]
MIDDGEYLYVVEYDSDAERKRVEYLFNNWSDGDVDAPKGLVRVASNVDHDALYRQLVSKVPDEQVSAYRLEPVETDVETDTRVVEQHVDAPREAVEGFVEYIFSKKKAVLQSPERNEYEVYTKKGRAEVSYDLAADGETTVTVRIEGTPPAPGFLADFFETELADYAASQKRS